MQSHRSRPGYRALFDPGRGRRPVPVTGGLHIVIVEDDILIAMDVAELLTELGHDVCATVRTEADAVAAAERCRPDLMIVDGQLDEGGGISAMRQILAKSEVAHLYITGDRRRLMQQVPDAVILEKPFSLSELLNGIDAALLGTGRPKREALGKSN